MIKSIESVQEEKVLVEKEITRILTEFQESNPAVNIDDLEMISESSLCTSFKKSIVYLKLKISL